MAAVLYPMYVLNSDDLIHQLSDPEASSTRFKLCRPADTHFYVTFCSFVALNIFTSACIIQIREGLKKNKKNMDISIFGSDPPTPLIWIKKDIVFGAF